jgi:hypothetical protein
MLNADYRRLAGGWVLVKLRRDNLGLGYEDDKKLLVESG